MTNEDKLQDEFMQFWLEKIKQAEQQRGAEAERERIVENLPECNPYSADADNPLKHIHLNTGFNTAIEKVLQVINNN